MNSVVYPLAASMFALGFVHAMGPDHLAALTVLAGTAPTPGRVFRTSLQFALGHAGVLLAAATLAFTLGLVPGDSAMRIAEIVGGLTLIAVGAATVHAALHRNEAVHVHHPGWLGSLLAASGTRSLVMAVPAAATGSVVDSLVLTAVFGLGVVAGMSGVGLAMSLGNLQFGASPKIRRGFSIASGLLAVAVGTYWTLTQTLA